MGLDPFSYNAVAITQLTLSNTKSRKITTELPLGGFGISRYCIDKALLDIAISQGVTIIQESVTNIVFQNDKFEIHTNRNTICKAKYVIGAYGKRSNLDVSLSRKFIKESSPYLAVKAHYAGDLTDNEVHLHNFKGGYCGLSKVETGLINVCYITDYKSFKKYKNIEDFQNKIMSQNKYLREAFKNYKMAFDKPLTISQVSFAHKQPVENHILMCGDSAGMIHPLAGNGMSMAIRSAQMVSNLIIKSENGEISSREELEKSYTQQWNAEFRSRLNAGHIIAKLFRITLLSDLLIRVAKVFPFIVPTIIKRTHGKPMTV